MITCQQLFEIFKKHDLTFFAGVPDSTFKDWMSFLADEHGKSLTNIIHASECEAVAAVTGYHLATKKTGIVYMQNSGLGKTVNPLTSLCDKEVYSIPALLMIGWRGEPGKHDEPQHKKMGRITLPLLDVLEVPYKILPSEKEGIEKVISEMATVAISQSRPTALIVTSDIIEKYEQKNKLPRNYEMSREDAIRAFVDNLNAFDVVVSTTGKTSRELFEYRKALAQGQEKDFLTVGSMGCASSIAHAIALSKPDRRVFTFDGDGAAIMQMGAMTAIGHYSANNLYHIIFDNTSYESTGEQPTLSPSVNFGEIAKSCGYKGTKTVQTKAELINSVKELNNIPGPYMLIVKVNPGSRKDLGRPTTTPTQNKEDFMRNLNS